MEPKGCYILTGNSKTLWKKAVPYPWKNTFVSEAAGSRLNFYYMQTPAGCAREIFGK